MNAVSSTWRQLVRRRLWPVALLLLAALAAVPVLLAREPAAPEPLAPVAVTTEADDTIAEPVVAQITPEDRSRRRRVLGVRKDPFRPAPLPKAAKAKTDESGAVPDVKAPSDSGAVVDPGTGGGAPTTGGQPAPKKRYYAPGTIIVRFGETNTDDLKRFAIEKFEPVPDPELPLLVYMGLTKNGKKAKFLVDATINAEGDGDCKPHPSNCETIELAVGETEFLDVLNPEPEEDTKEDEEETEEEAEPDILAQFQLDLVDIKRAGDDDVK